MQGLEDAQCGLLFDSAYFRRNIWVKANLLQTLVTLISNLVHGEIGFGNQVLERDAAFWILPEILARGSDGTTIIVGDLFVLLSEQNLKQIYNGRQLAGSELLKQIVRVLLYLESVDCHIFQTDFSRCTQNLDTSPF